MSLLCSGKSNEGATSRANPAVAMRCPSGKKPAKSTPKVGRTGGGERRRKSECGSAERFVVSPEEVGSLCVISKVSSEAQRRLARSSDTRRSANAAEAARKQARVSEASVRLSGKQQSFSCCPVSSSCACASAACVRTRSSDNVQPTRHTVGTAVCEEHTTGAREVLHTALWRGGGERRKVLDGTSCETWARVERGKWVRV